MGLTKEQLKERAIQRTRDFLSKYGQQVESTTKYKLSEISKSLPDEEHIITHKWDKDPICAQDICVFSCVMFNDGSIIYCDYDNKTNSISDMKHIRVAKDIETSYIDGILMDMESNQGVESSVPVRKKPEKINRYKKYGR